MVGVAPLGKALVHDQGNSPFMFGGYKRILPDEAFLASTIRESAGTYHVFHASVVRHSTDNGTHQTVDDWEDESMGLHDLSKMDRLFQEGRTMIWNISIDDFGVDGVKPTGDDRFELIFLSVCSFCASDHCKGTC